MKVLRYVLILLAMCMFTMLQACGSGNTDTSGALTMTLPTIVDNGDGNYLITTTVTYAPPAGKTAQGVVVSLQITDSNGIVYPSTQTLTSGSNSILYTVLVPKNKSTYFNVRASIGDMSTSTVIGVTPVITISPSAVGFVPTDKSATSYTLTISGGTAPYSVASSTSDITATLSSSTLIITLAINPSSPGVLTTATVTLTDSSATPLTKTVTVTYYK